MTRWLVPIALAWLLLADAAVASPFEWEITVRRVGSQLVITDGELGVDPMGHPRSRQHVLGTAIDASVAPIALAATRQRTHWDVLATAIFAPDSGATTFLEELAEPHADDASLAPTPADDGHLQPLPAFETRARPLPDPPAVTRARIRYRGELSAMLPLSVGFLGLIVVGRRPKNAAPR